MDDSSNFPNFPTATHSAIWYVILQSLKTAILILYTVYCIVYTQEISNNNIGCYCIKIALKVCSNKHEIS